MADWERLGKEWSELLKLRKETGSQKSRIETLQTALEERTRALRKRQVYHVAGGFYRCALCDVAVDAHGNSLDGLSGPHKGPLCRELEG